MKLDRDFRVGILGAGTVGLTLASFFEKAQISHSIFVKKIPEKPVNSLFEHNHMTLTRDRFTLLAELIIREKFDLIISTVKRSDLKGTVKDCERILKRNGFILSLQNGINICDDYETLSDRVIHAPIFLISELLDNNIKILQKPEIVLPINKHEQIRSLMGNAHIKVIDSLDMNQSIWKKMIFSSSISGVCSLLDEDAKGIKSNHEPYTMFMNAVIEAYAVAVKEGVSFDTNVLDDSVRSLERLPDQFRPSMAYDFLHHRKSEISWLSGVISNLGKKRSVPVLTHDTIFEALWKREMQYG